MASTQGRSAQVSFAGAPRHSRAAAAAPDLYSFRLSFSTQPDGINEGDIDFVIDGSSITGTGTMLDSNGLLIPFGETMPFSFEASC